MKHATNYSVMKIEKFLEARANQAQSKVVYFRNCLKNPPSCVVKNPVTQKDVDDAELDAEKCMAALKFLQEKYPKK